MFLERSEFYHEILLAYYMYTCVYVTSIYAIHPLWHTWTRLSYICILYMYVYQCIFIFLLRDHDNDLFYSEFYPFINSLSLALKEMEREAEVYVYIYSNMYQLCFLYFFETLNDTCRCIYMIIY